MVIKYHLIYLFIYFDYIAFFFNRYIINSVDFSPLPVGRICSLIAMTYNIIHILGRIQNSRP